jgi:hypothetical protein
MKRNFLAHKRRSVWKNFILLKNYKNYMKFNYELDDFCLLLKRNFIISLFLIRKYKFCYLLNNKRWFRFKFSKKFLGYKIGQLLLTKRLGINMHLIKKKKKKK